MDEALEIRDFVQLPRTAVAQGDDIIALQPIAGPVQGIELSRLIGRLGPVDVVAATFADLTLAWDPGKLAIVYADPDPAKVGYHVKLGANGAGSWVYSDVFRGFPGAAGAAGSKYRFGGSIEAALAASEVVFRHVLQVNVNFADDFAGSIARRAPGVAAPGANQALSIKVDGVAVGSVTFASGGGISWVTTAGPLAALAGAEIRLEMPAAAPAAELLGASFTFSGTEAA
ncbi:MAG: hypothetical protein ABIO43_08325 [Sphingomicrobium sp.]